MNSDITLTFHATERLHQRSCETLESLREIICGEKYIRIGQETGSNREHFLFFSLPDDIWHILIMDVKTKEIITVLPVDFHENISWKVSQETLEKAKRLAMSAVSADPAVTPTAKPSVVRILGLYFESWNLPKRVNLGSWPFNHSLELSEFAADDDFWSTVRFRISEKGKSDAEIVEITILRGKRSVEQIRLDLPDNWPNGQQGGVGNVASRRA